MGKEVSGRARGGVATAKAMTTEQKANRGAKGAVARWGLKATHKGNFQDEFGIDVECFVLNDAGKSAVISQRGMGLAIGYSEGGSRLTTLVRSKTLAPYLGRELIEKLENPLIFQGITVGANSPPPPKIHGYDVTILIDLCKSIVQAESESKLRGSQEKLAKQAHIILSASAKAGIKGLVYALAGYSPEAEEVIAAFKAYVQEEAKKYEKEFPPELYLQWARLYEIKPPLRGKSWKNLHLTIDHIYYPLAKSDGNLLKLLRESKAKNGDKNTKLFQFLNEIGARALRIQLGRVLEMAESSPQKETYEAKIIERFGGQQNLDFGTT